MTISLIAALTNNYVIGNNNQLPWHIKEELNLFKQHTLGKTIVMGKNTLLSIGRALPNRNNIVLTKAKDFTFPNVTVVNDYNDILQLPEVWIIGGAQIYQLFLPYAKNLYLSFIKQDYIGDTYFPNIDWTKWQLIAQQEFSEFIFKCYGVKNVSTNHDGNSQGNDAGVFCV